MAGKFDPKKVPEEERIRLGLQPASSGETARKTTTFADNVPDEPAQNKPPPPKRPTRDVPAPPPRSDYPQPPADQPPMTKQQRQVEEGMNYSLYRPSVWEVDKQFYEWADRKVDDRPYFPLPKGWTFDHMS